MEINDLKNKSAVKELVVTIEQLFDTTVLNSGIRVRKAIVSDTTGQVALKLWNDQADEFSVGDKVLVKGWSQLFMEGTDNEEMELSSGKYGFIKKVV